jgi:hypothetical protein
MGPKPDLTLAVVAERRRLEHRRPADFSDSVLEINFTANGCKGCDRQAKILQVRLLTNPVLRDFEGTAVRSHDRVGFRRRHGRCRHVFKLKRHDVDATRKLPNAIDIVVRRDDLDVGDLASRRVVFGSERVDAIAHASCGHGKHAAELAAAEDANHRAGLDGARRHESRSRRTASAISRR